MNNSTDNRLEALSDSNFEIADNEPNIKGWTVKDQQGRKVGEVDDLIFDRQTCKVRYLVIDLEGNLLDLEPHNVLVPIGIAELHASDNDVILPGVTADNLRPLPVYRKGQISRDIETVTVGAFRSGGSESGKDFYAQDHFDEEKAYRNRPATGTQAVPIIEEKMKVGKQEVEKGTTRLHTRIVEKPVEKNVTLREEHVNVERNPVNRPVTEADMNAFKEGEIEIKEHAEIPVVGKEARVVEEINMKKEVTEREETIKGTVRSTEVKVDKLNPNQNQNPNLPPTAGQNPNEPPTGARNPNMPPNQNPNQNPTQDPNRNPNINPNKPNEPKR